jgi:hypothetical protein
MATPSNTRPSHIPDSQGAGSRFLPQVGARNVAAGTIRLRRMAQFADIKANEVLLACAIGDLSWLQRGIAGGSNPGATNKEVSAILRCKVK